MKGCTTNALNSSIMWYSQLKHLLLSGGNWRRWREIMRRAEQKKRGCTKR